jgi:hypothetical protein
LRVDGLVFHELGSKFGKRDEIFIRRSLSVVEMTDSVD